MKELHPLGLAVVNCLLQWIGEKPVQYRLGHFRLAALVALWVTELGSVQSSFVEVIICATV